MKKFLSVLLSVLMLITCMIPMVSAANEPYQGIESATVLLDQIDKKIAESEIAKQFEAFLEQYPVTGLTAIKGIDDIIGYKDLAVAQGVLDTIGGDFANLDGWDLLVKRNGDDSAFINGVIAFMAKNKDVLGKVFSWTPDGTPFDYGKIGEFIESDNYTNTEVKKFYQDNLKNGYDIQAKFTEEIAREMGYTIPKGESFDDTLNNGIKNSKIGQTLRKLLKSEASLSAFDAFSTKDTTKDVYEIIKEYIQLLQNDYKGELDTAIGNIINEVGKALTTAKSSFDGIDIPEVTIGYTGNKEFSKFTPKSTNIEDYMPTIYVNDQAKSYMDQYDANIPGVEVKMNSEMTDADKAFVSGTATNWGKDVIVDVNNIAPEKLAAFGANLPITIVLDDAEKAVIETLKTGVNGKGTDLGGVAFNISDAQATFSYKAYKQSDGSMAIQVKVESATAKVNVTAPVTATVTTNLLDPDATVVDLGGMYAMFNDTAKSMAVSAIKTAIGDMFKDPAFITVIFRVPAGNGLDLSEVKEMLGYIEDTITYDDDLLDLFKDGRYETYKGAVGQANRIVVDAADMFLTDAGMKYFGIDATNNIDTNIENIRTKANDLLTSAKTTIDTLKKDDNFAEYIEGINLDIDFGLLDKLDLSSNEGLYVSMINLAGDYLPESMTEVKPIIDTVQGYKTLDEMLIALINKYAPKDEICGYTFSAITYSGNAEDDIMKEATKAIFTGAEWALEKANAAASEISAKLGLGEVKFELGVTYSENNWKASLEALVDRFISLTDGLFISPITGSGVYGKLGDILYKVLPMDSMFSNVTSGADVAKIPGYVFNDALNGNFANLLSLAETKKDTVAGGVSINKALINASERIVSAFFPTTVSAASYDDKDGVQEYFTGAKNDPQIAARNMQDIANRKADLVPCALNLLKESGVLTGICDHTYGTNDTETKASTCSTHGTATAVCKACGETLSEPKELPLNPDNHEGPFETVDAKDATTEEEGFTGNKVCKACGEVAEPGTSIPKIVESQNFFQRIISTIRGFFTRILDAIRNIFRR